MILPLFCEFDVCDKLFQEHALAIWSWLSLRWCILQHHTIVHALFFIVHVVSNVHDSTCLAPMRIVLFFCGSVSSQVWVAIFFLRPHTSSTQSKRVIQAKPIFSRFKAEYYLPSPRVVVPVAPVAWQANHETHRTRRIQNRLDFAKILKKKIENVVVCDFWFVKNCG